jgi:transcriptional/translational regulatory protein YebC/TACO1
MFSKHGGNLGENGCVSWMFDKKGSIVIEKKTVGEDALMEVAIEAGADDVRDQETEWEVITDPQAFDAVKTAIEKKGWKTLEARVGLIPQNTIRLEAGKAEQMLKLMDRLEDNDDVQNVYANFDIPDEVMEQLNQ